MQPVNLDDLLEAMRDEAAAPEEPGPAREAFWRAAHGEVWGFFRSRYNRLLADELTQRTLCVVLEKLDKYERRGSNTFIRWLRRICKIELLKYQAEEARRPKWFLRTSRPAVGTSPESRRRRGEQLDLIDQHKKDLTTMQREAVEYGDNHELAEAKEITVDAARMRWARAVEALEKLLQRARRTLRRWRTPRTSRVRMRTS